MTHHITLDEQAFLEIMNKLDALERKLEPVKESKSIGWLNNEQFCEALQISKRSAQNYRDQGMIPYSKVEGKIYYKVTDVEKLLSSNYQTQ